MKRFLVAGATLAFGVACAGDASAFEFGTPEQVHPYRSPQHFALELRFSPYYPDIDDDPSLSGRPFENAFGDNPRILMALEFDWQILRIPHLGTLGAGFGIGYLTMGRDVRTVSGRTSGDSTSLEVIPMWTGAVFRVDTLWRRVGFPFIPYAKAGVALGYWRAGNSGGTAEVDGFVGRGASWGTNLALGVMFALDFFDRGAGRNMDAATGINGTYLFFEGYSLALNGIAQEHALRVGTTTWAAGLAFEF